MGSIRIMFPQVSYSLSLTTAAAAALIAYYGKKNENVDHKTVIAG